MLVWLTEWQLAEDHVLIRVGDVVDWVLYESDRDWMARLFADRLALEWQFDTYGDAVDQPSRPVRGRVTELRSVRCRQVDTAEGRVPVTGAAHLQPVDDTSGSWSRDPAAHDDPAALYGYVLTLDLTVTARARSGFG